MSDTATITAVVTATGDDSYAPDQEGAADALIALDGEHLCCVTLLAGSIWGSVDHWCDDSEALDIDDIDREDLIAAIEEAVQAALSSTEATGWWDGTATVERCDWL